MSASTAAGWLTIFAAAEYGQPDLLSSPLGLIGRALMRLAVWLERPDINLKSCLSV